MAKKYKRFVIAFDNHGDMIDPDARKQFFKFLKEYKPDIRIHGGDAFDLRALRSNVSKDESVGTMSDDIEMGIEFIKEFDPSIWILGNHDHRIQKAIDGSHDGKVRDLCQFLWNQIVDQVSVDRIIQYGKRYYLKLGNYKVLHGYHAGVNAARQLALKYGNAIMGHVHTPDRHKSERVDQVIAYTSGCLCNLDMEYNLGHVNTMKQAHGWIYGEVCKDHCIPQLYEIARPDKPEYEVEL